MELVVVEIARIKRQRVVERKFKVDMVSVEICLLARLREVEVSAQEKHQIHFSEHKFFGQLPLFIIHPRENVRLTR